MKQGGLFDWVPDGLRRGRIRTRPPSVRATFSARQCARCETTFQPIRSTQRFCSKRCRNAANALRDYYKHRDQRRAAENSDRQLNPDKWTQYRRAYQSANREKLTATARVWREKNSDRVLDGHFKRNYGITLDEYNRMLTEQGGGCGICGARVGGSKNQGVRLHVDHDHVTGKARGLLCGTCNRGIGQLGDDLERVLAAVRYLQRTREPKTESEVG